MTICDWCNLEIDFFEDKPNIIKIINVNDKFCICSVCEQELIPLLKFNETDFRIEVREGKVSLDELTNLVADTEDDFTIRVIYRDVILTTVHTGSYIMQEDVLDDISNAMEDECNEWFATKKFIDEYIHKIETRRDVLHNQITELQKVVIQE